MVRSIALALAAVALCAAAAYGHGVTWSMLKEEPVAVRFAYSGGEPMAYAEVLVFGPESSPDLEFQNGRTDARGGFAFTPDTPGKWTVIANDGTGHRTEAVVAVGDGRTTPPATAQATAGAGPTPMAVVLGLSLLANAVLAVGLVRKRR